MHHYPHLHLSTSSVYSDPILYHNFRFIFSKSLNSIFRINYDSLSLQLIMWCNRDYEMMQYQSVPLDGIVLIFNGFLLFLVGSTISYSLNFFLFRSIHESTVKFVHKRFRFVNFCMRFVVSVFEFRFGCRSMMIILL